MSSLHPWALQAVLLAATITATGLSLDNGFAGFVWPRWQDGARRLERDSDLKHRPISERGDLLIGEDPFAQHLWHLHQSRPLPAEGQRVAMPDPDLHRRDPKNLRYFALLALAVGLIIARQDAGQRLLRAFDSGAGANLGLDAWVDPPPYTGLAPIYLAHGDSAAIFVPTGSLLNLRVHGGDHAPGVALGDGSRPRFAGGNGRYAVRHAARLTGDAASSRARQRPCHRRLEFAHHSRHSAQDCLHRQARAHRTCRNRLQLPRQRRLWRDRRPVIIRPHGKARRTLIVNLPLAAASAKSDEPDRLC